MIYWAKRRSVNFLVGVCAAISVCAFILAIWTVVRQSQADAVHAADRKAQAVSQVNACYQQVENTPKVLKILELIQTLAENSIISNEAAIAATSPNDKLTSVREDALNRLRPAAADMAEYIRETKATAPTVADCAALAKHLHVDRKVQK